jgi:hypothetical protein
MDQRPQLSASTLVRRPGHVAHVRDGANTVLLHLPSGRRVGLSGSGTVVWEQVSAAGEVGASAASVTEAVAAQYDAGRAVIEAGVRQLLDDLLAADLVERVEPTAT